MSKKVYEIVTDIILEKLEKGTAGWAQGWRNQYGINAPVSATTGNLYRGINRLLLPPGEYVTFNEVQRKKGKVKKGETGHLVTFFKELRYKDAGAPDESMRSYFMFRYYKVFELSQCEGIERRYSLPEKDTELLFKPITPCEKILKDFEDRPVIKNNGGDRAYYQVSTDSIHLPAKKMFNSTAEYYATLFHELSHSTGHSTRLNRNGIVKGQEFGSDEYAIEELIAELSASYLASISGIAYKTLDNSASYIDSWRKRLKADPKLIVQIASQSQKATDLILGEIKVA